MNNIALTGNLAKDVELKQTHNTGASVSSFILAVKRSNAKEGEQQADFIYIQVFGKTAENCAKYLEKGSKVAVTGELRIDNYFYEGQNRTFTKVIANRVEFLSSKNKEQKQDSEVAPELEANFQAIDDDDIPF